MLTVNSAFISIDLFSIRCIVQNVGKKKTCNRLRLTNKNTFAFLIIEVLVKINIEVQSNHFNNYKKSNKYILQLSNKYTITTAEILKNLYV